MAVATRRVPFDENKHPRGRHGQFVDVVGRMTDIGATWDGDGKAWLVPVDREADLELLLADLGLVGGLSGGLNDRGNPGPPDVPDRSNEDAVVTPFDNQTIDVTPEQRDALNAYVDESFDMNRRLRLGEPLPHQEEDAGLIDAVIDSVTTPRPVVAYRAVSAYDINEFVGFYGLEPGVELRDAAFSSATLDRAVAASFAAEDEFNFAPGFIIEIDVPQGTNAAYLPALGLSGNQDELLFGRNHPLVVTAIDTNTNTIRVKAGEQRASTAGVSNLKTSPTNERVSDLGDLTNFAAPPGRRAGALGRKGREALAPGTGVWYYTRGQWRDATWVGADGIMGAVIEIDGTRVELSNASAVAIRTT